MMNYCQRTAIGFGCLLAVTILFVLPCSCFATPSLEEVEAEFKYQDLEGRLAIIGQLEGQRDRETVDFLITLAGGKENWQVKIRAIQFLGEAGNPKAVDVLLRIFNSQALQYQCPAIRTYTAIALGNFRGEGKILDSLIRFIDNDEPQVREAIVQSLGKMADARAVPYLIPLLYDKSIAIRLSAITALERIADPQAIRHMKDLAEKDSDETVRRAAENALEGFHRN